MSNAAVFYCIKSISNGYIPIPQVPERTPGLRVPRSISVIPVAGRFFLMPSSGILKEEEQSNVPRVVILSVVGTPALAMVFSGVNPPFATRSIVCLSPCIKALPSEGVTPPFEPPKSDKKIKLETAIPAKIMKMEICFEDIKK